MTAKGKSYEKEFPLPDIGRFISEFAGDIVALLDTQGRLLWVNDAIERTLGYTAEEFHILREEGGTVLYPEDIIAIRSTFERFLESPEHQVITLRARHKDGRMLRFEQTRDPILDDDGNLKYVLTIAHQVGEQGEGSAVFRDFGEHFKLVFDQVPSACLCYDRDGKILMFNSEAEKMYGFSASDVIGKYIYETIAPSEERYDSLRVIDEVFWGKSFRGLEWKDKRKDGTILSVVSNLFPVFGPDGSVNMCLSSNIDITSIKETEDALRLSEEKYRTLLGNIQDGTFVIQNKRMVYINEAFARLFGYSVHEVVGEEFTKFVHPDDLEFVSARHAARMRGEDVPREYEFRGLHSDGETTVYVNMTVGVFDYGDSKAAIGTLKNITERKKAEKELRDSEERFRRLSEASLEGIVVHEAGRILDINKRFAELIGREPSELIGTIVYDLAVPHSRDLLMKNMLSPSDEPFETEILRTNGSSLTIEIRGKLFPYKDRIVRLISLRDVSSYRNAMVELEKSEMLFRMVAGNLGEGLLITDIDTLDVTYANTKMAEMSGFKVEEMLGKPVYELLLPEDAVGRLTERNRQRKLGQSETYEIELKHKTGRKFWTQITASPFRDENDNVIGTLAVVKDISERKATELALRQSEEKFRNISEEISDALAITIDGVIKWANSAFSELFGDSNSTYIGSEFISLVHAKEKGIAHSAIIARLSGIPSEESLEIRAIRGDGELLFLDFTARRIVFENNPAALLVLRNITERKHAEAAMRKNEQQYRALVEKTNAVPWELDIDSQKFTYIGPQVENVFGYTSALWTNVEFWQSVIHPSDRATATDFRLNRRDPASPTEFEYRMFTADGRTIWVRDILSFEQDETDARLVRGLLFDITERKKLELLQTVLLGISESATTVSNLAELAGIVHRNLGVLMDASNFFIALYDEEKEEYFVPYFADQYDDLSGISQKQWKHGKTDLVRKTGKPHLIDLRESAKLKKGGEVELVGSPSLLWLGVPIKTETGTIGVMAVQTYSDERLYDNQDLDLLTVIAGHVGQALLKLRALEELSRSEEKFRTLAENVPGAIYLCHNDEHYTMTYLNDKIEELTGYSKDAFINNEITYASIMHVDDLKEVRNIIEEALTADRIFHLRYRIKHRSGEWRWVEEFGKGVVEDGELLYLEGFIHDISERNHAEGAI